VTDRDIMAKTWASGLSVCAFTAIAQRLHVINGCSQEPMWIAAHGSNGYAETIKLNPGQQHDFDVDGKSALRYWPKMGCDASGQQCRLGDSGGPGQTCKDGLGCAPPVDSKFEITPTGSVDWWDTSAVDGYTLPFKVDLSSECRGQSPDIDCSGLTLDNCPSENIQNYGTKSLNVKHPTFGGSVGCYSPCGLLTYRNWNNPDGNHGNGDNIAGPYCCPPPWTPESCRAGPSASMHFTSYIHSKCPHTYAYSYDDADGLHTCPPNTHYTWTLFCPSGGSPVPPPPPSPRPTPTPMPTPTPSGGAWQPCNGGVCCNPHTPVKQYCPGGFACQECGGGDACQCPSQVDIAV